MKHFLNKLKKELNNIEYLAYLIHFIYYSSGFP